MMVLISFPGLNFQINIKNKIAVIDDFKTMSLNDTSSSARIKAEEFLQVCVENKTIFILQ